MTWPVIIKDGPDRNQTLAIKKFENSSKIYVPLLQLK